MLRLRWRRSRHWAELDRIERISKAVVDTERGGQLVVKYTAQLSSTEIVAKAEAAQRAVSGAINS
ncbi:hypothetical protein NKJ73_07065 [Mesorhizobium sp. M0074]|uniref:hypothetical protein n=1 Tax=unclassified Mesorhizobium TaxID=325217 RepID=UPI0033364DC3